MIPTERSSKRACPKTGEMKARSRKPAGIAGRLGATLFFAFFLALGLFFLVMIGKSVVEMIGTRAWTPVPAVILTSGVTETNHSEDHYAAGVSYRYEWEGRTLISTNLTTGNSRHARYHQAADKIADFPPGATTTCYVDPKNPSRAVLRQGTPWIALFGFIPLIFVLIGAGGIYGTWRPERLRKSPVSRTPRRGFSPRLFGGLFLLIGLALLFAWVIPGTLKALDSSRWIQTPCKIVSSRVGTNASSDGDTHFVDILYRYTFEGREYTSDRYNIVGGSSSGRAGKADIVKKYPRGSQAVCYVNPARPREAVLRPGITPMALLGLIPLAFVAVGIAVLAWSRRVSPGEAAEAALAGRPAAPGRTAGPLAKFLGFLAAALFWNGIVSVFVWQAVLGFQRGRPDWLLTLFMVPFVLIGLGLIGAVFYAALALANPRCRFTVNPPAAFPGGEFEVSWTFHGAVHRIRRLRIFLEGTEEATYSRGTSSTTDRKTFARITLADLSTTLEIAQGSARTRLPAGTMPSFASDHNRIVWSVKVHGEIPRWPDVGEEQEFLVHPKP